MYRRRTTPSRPAVDRLREMTGLDQRRALAKRESPVSSDRGRASVTPRLGRPVPEGDSCRASIVVLLLAVRGDDPGLRHRLGPEGHAERPGRAGEAVRED